jgi:hypothetical protein
MSVVFYAVRAKKTQAGQDGSCSSTVGEEERVDVRWQPPWEIEALSQLWDIRYLART